MELSCVTYAHLEKGKADASPLSKAPSNEATLPLLGQTAREDRRWLSSPQGSNKAHPIRGGTR